MGYITEQANLNNIGLDLHCIKTGWKLIYLVFLPNINDFVRALNLYRSYIQVFIEQYTLIF